MMRYALAILIAALFSLVFFPWPLTLLLALLAAPFVPLGPLALGVLADALYGLPGALPFATLLGLFVTLAALFVHKRLAPALTD
jgi:hypothetical protein